MSRLDTNSTLACTSVVVAGTVLLGCAGPAQAGGRYEGFKEFRNLNPGVSLKTLHSMWLQHTGRGPGPEQGGDGRPPFNIQPVWPSSGPSPSGAPPIISVLSAASLNSNVEKHLHRGIGNRSFQTTAAGDIVRTDKGVDLYLGSTTHDIKLGGRLFEGADSVTVNTSDGTKTFTVGSEVTAAEYVAVRQVLSGHAQSVTLDGQGRATGGSVDFGSLGSKTDRIKVDDLTVPINVTALGDFSKDPVFQVGGDLLNLGSVYAYSTAGRPRQATISADNITNADGAVISTNVPVTFVSQLGDREAQPVNLNLHANNSLANYGIISSSGDLNISAGNQITNASNRSIWAQGNVSVTAPNINNAGLINSVNGNLTVDGSNDAVLNVTNTGGTLMANQGAINIRNADFNGPFNTYVSGGDFLSKEVNVNAGSGVADINIGQMTGTLNQKGNASHVIANSSNLSLGKICLTGDPTYSNIAGDITLNGDITVGEALTIVASGNVISGTPLTITANNATQGFPVTIIAGANVTAGGSSSSLGPIPPAVSGVITTIGTGTAPGGNILFAAQPVTINTRPATKTTANGGDVYLAAFSGAGILGVVQLGGGTITTGGAGAGTNGNVTILAGSSGAGAANDSLGTINTTGGTGGGGDISVETRQPNVGVPVTFAADGSISSGSLPGAIGSANTAFDMALTGPLTAAGNILLNSGPITFPAVSKFGLTANASGQIQLVAPRIDLTNSNFFSTKTLFLTIAGGSVGEGGVTALQTNASTIVANGSLASSEIVIVSYNKGLVLFSGQADVINFSSAGTFMSNPSLAPITGNTVLIGSFSGATGLNIANPVEVDAVNLFVTAGKAGNMFAHNSNVGTTTLLNTTTMTAKDTWSLVSDDDLAMDPTAVISAPHVQISTGGAFNALNGTINGSVDVSLSSADPITNANIPATINTPLLNLTSTSGDIGAVGNRYNPNVGVKGITVSAVFGDVLLGAPQTAGKSFKIAGVFAQSFDYLGSGSTTISGNWLSSVGDLNVVTATGTLSSDGAGLLSSGNILLQVTDDTSTKIKISVGGDSQLQTVAAPLGGGITFALGSVINQVAGLPPAKGVSFVETGGGNIFWGTSGISAKGLNNVIAKGADVTFSNSLSSKNINLGGNVNIIADPPVPAGSATISGGGIPNIKYVAGIGDIVSTASSSNSGAQPPVTTTNDDAFKTLLSSINTVGQNNLNIVTAEQAAVLTDSFLSDDDDSVFISRGPSSPICPGSLCSDQNLFGAVTTGGSADQLEHALRSSVAHMPISDHMDMKRSGRSLFVPNQDTVIETNFGDVSIKAGAVVLVSLNDKGIALFNVHDNAKNSVSIKVGDKSVSLSPGRHVLLTKDKSGQFVSANHVETIMHRGIASTSVGEDMTMYSSEFSTLSAVASFLPLRAVFTSQHPESKKLAGKLLKTTAVLMHISGGSGDFRYHIKPRMTAMNSLDLN